MVSERRVLVLRDVAVDLADFKPQPPTYFGELRPGRFLGADVQLVCRPYPGNGPRVAECAFVATQIYMAVC